MDLSFNTKMDAYYHQFFELQERLRRSEEERLKLEMRFNELVQISKEEEQAHYKKLRAQYKKFLEEDRKRQERNEKIIRTLERIESRVNMLTSKTERIKLLRRQYQSYLQRVAQRPTEKREYYPPKIAEEVPTGERNQPYDYSKKSCNIAMLKKAYGKTNEEKIEILDKYLQSLKSQKEPTVPENKPNDLNELKYFDEVSKKLNEGFNSNEANSIAEEIMNSIYARHYKPELLKDEAKNVSKFTSPNSAVGFSDKDRNSGMGDSNYTTGLKYNFSSEGKLYPNINSEPIKYSGGVSPMSKSNFNPLEKTKEIHGFGDSYDTSKSEIDLKENEKQEVCKINYIDKLTKNNELEIQQVDEMSIPIISSKGETNNPVENIEFDKSTGKDLSQQVLTEVKVPYAAEDRKFVDTTDETSELEDLEMQNNNASPNTNTSHKKLENETENSNIPENDITLHKIEEQIQQNESRPDVEEIKEPHIGNESKNGNLKPDNDEENVQEISIDECNGQINDQNAQLYEQSNQDDREQPIEQLYGEDVKAEQLDLQSYEEEANDIQQENYIKSDYNNEQPVQQCDENGVIQNYDEYAQQYDDNGQPVQQYDENIQQYDENGPQIQQISENNEPFPQYDENSQPIHEKGLYDENSQPVQQYDQADQSVQHFDESGQPIAHHYGDQPVQQFNENGQPLLQYDENEQPLLQYDENGQVIPQYDESGQPIGQYDGSGQQYDENGQPVYYQGEELVQYDENGQIIQQYDEHGQPIVPTDPYQQYDVTDQTLDENGQIPQQYEGHQYGESDQLLENKSDLPEEQQVLQGEAVQAPKKNNVLDLLDTDSESVKQNTSKITNDSDFDFSNG